MGTFTFGGIDTGLIEGTDGFYVSPPKDTVQVG